MSATTKKGWFPPNTALTPGEREMAEREDLRWSERGSRRGKKEPNTKEGIVRKPHWKRCQNQPTCKTPAVQRSMSLGCRKKIREPEGGQKTALGLTLRIREEGKSRDCGRK